MRILNTQDLVSHGNRQGRSDAVQILEAGLQGADPSVNVPTLLRVEGDRLIVGGRDFEPDGDPRAGEEVFDLRQVDRIFVIGAGKGVQHIARAIEGVLDDRLAGGHVIDKHGADMILRRIGVTLGAHPVPDEGCLAGSSRILDLCRGLHEDDLVFTIAANGISSLLTLPVPGVSLEDVRRVTYLMQIARGAPTSDLNPVRNHLDLLKGGRISANIHPATAIHLVATDPNGAGGDYPGYDYFMHRNLWLHTLPDCTTFQDAIAMLKKWDAWDEVPASVRAHLERADPAQETVKAGDFAAMRFRVFGIAPDRLGMLPSAARRAAELGYTPHILCSWLEGEASQAAVTVASIARSIESRGQPFQPPCALLTNGELTVTVGEEDGIGGRNQEYVLAAALRIAGSSSIVMAGLDSDGTDGPGGQFVSRGAAPPTLAGGVVDGETVEEAAAAGIDLRAELRRHNSSPVLRGLRSGVHATPGIGVCDLGVTLITERS